MTQANPMIEPLLITTVRVRTFNGPNAMTGASGFFFKRDKALYLVTSRHVFLDEPTNHRPNRIEIELHTDEADLGRSTGYSIPLYEGKQPIWREAKDPGGPVDVALVPIDVTALPATASFEAFTPDSIQPPTEGVEIGTTLLAVGYPLGFEDALHHLPVARQAGLASSFGLRFQGKGYFLIDARTHRGISGAPVVMRAEESTKEDTKWKLLGIHSARLESSTRDPALDETLGLNSVWYADVLMTLTENEPTAASK